MHYVKQSTEYISLQEDGLSSQNIRTQAGAESISNSGESNINTVRHSKKNLKNSKSPPWTSGKHNFDAYTYNSDIPMAPVLGLEIALKNKRR